MNDNLTESQKNLLKAMKREMVEVTQPIMDEITKLRQEQKERHEQGLRDAINQHEIEYARLRRNVVRLAKSLLALFGKDDDN